MDRVRYILVDEPWVSEECRRMQEVTTLSLIIRSSTADDVTLQQQARGRAANGWHELQAGLDSAPSPGPNESERKNCFRDEVPDGFLLDRFVPEGEKTKSSQPTREMIRYMDNTDK